MRDLINSTNVDPADGDFPYGRTRDTTVSTNGTAIYERVFGDFLISLQKIANYTGEIPDNTVEKELPVDGVSTEHNYQLVDAFAKYIRVVISSEWKGRNDEVISGVLNASQYIQNINDVLTPNLPNRLSTTIDASDLGQYTTIKNILQVDNIVWVWCRYDITSDDQIRLFSLDGSDFVGVAPITNYNETTSNAIIVGDEVWHPTANVAGGSVIRYDKEINLLGSFGNQGSNPDEFDGIFGVFKTETEVFFVESNNKRISVYDYSATYVRTIDLSAYDFPKNGFISNNTIFVAPFDSGDQKIIKLEIDGSFISEFNFSSEFGLAFNIMYTFNGLIYCVTGANAPVYCLNTDFELVGIYEDFGPVQDIATLVNGAIWIPNQQTTGDTVDTHELTVSFNNLSL